MNKKRVACSAQNLTKVYPSYDGEHQVFSGVNIELCVGELMTITGPSGCGKTTLLHILGLLDLDYSGALEIGGVGIEKINNNILAGLRNKYIGMVFQSFNLIPRLSVLNNVTAPLVYSNVKRSEREKRAIECLKVVGLSSKANEYPSRLSGGQKQRVAVARALVNDPICVLADEPTGNLDQKNTDLILDLLSSLKELDKGILVITHDLDVFKRGDKKIRIANSGSFFDI